MWKRLILVGLEPVEIAKLEVTLGRKALADTADVLERAGYQ
jgi:hypothetical protein